MSKRILAAMIEIESLGSFGGVNKNSYDAFDQALSRADAMMQEFSDTTHLKMLVAPEYIFSHHSAPPKGAPQLSALTRSGKHSLYAKLKASSLRYPNILIIPGSIAYKKGGIITQKKYFNVSPVLAGGQIIHKVYKAANDEYLSKDSFATKDTGYSFDYNGVTFGVDICLDHGEKALKSSLNGGRVDVHVLISYGFSPSTAGIATDENGVVVFCDMKDTGGNGVKSVFMNRYGNPNTSPSQTITRTDQALTGGYKIALYQGEIHSQ